ncbi:MAG: hypothetical protein AB2556_24780 [Candidatus Thiodiazotropha sp.]
MIDEILAEIPDPFPGQFTDLDDQVPHPVRLPEILNDVKDEFELDGAAAVFSLWSVEEEDPLDIGDIEVADGIHVRAGRLALDACMKDERAARLLNSLPKDGCVLKLKFLREQQESEWVVEDKFVPIRMERKKGQAIIEISRDTKPGVLNGIDRVFYQNTYPISAVAYGLYPIKDTDPANPAPLRDGDLNCVAQRVVEFLEGALRG